MRPQAFLVETGDFPQRVVSTAMGVAGEIVQRLELAEDSDIAEVPRACFSSSRVAILLRSSNERSSSERKERGLIML